MKADVYSFGIVRFEILSGEKPFGDVQVTDLYSKLTAPFPLRPRLPSSCPTALASLVCACWDADPLERPAFADVCRVLRYLKGVQLLTEVHESKLCLAIDQGWPFGRLTAKVQKQGPWGVVDLKFDHLLTERNSGPVCDIRELKVHLRDEEKLELRGFSFFFRGDLALHETIVGGSGESSHSIRFDHPSEYLVQVEGSCMGPYGFQCLSSVSFITTKQKYGRYGQSNGPTTPFCSEPGRVVGFDWIFGGWRLLSLGVSVIPDIIVGCLRNFLDEGDHSA